MDRRAFVAGLAGLALLAGCQVLQIVQGEAQSAADMVYAPFKNVTAVTYNVRAGLGLDGVRDIARAAAVIREAKPDLVALQEVDRGTSRSGGVDQLAELERLTGMHGTFCRTASPEGGESGIAILSRGEPLKVQTLELPGTGEGRMLLIAEFPEYSFGSIHLPPKEEDRLACAPKLRALVGGEKPFILAGDWNDGLRSAFVRDMRQSYSIVSGFDNTFPADRPDRCIDFIAVSRRHRARFEHVTHEVLPEAVASDHRPVFVKLR